VLERNEQRVQTRKVGGFKVNDAWQANSVGFRFFLDFPKLLNWLQKRVKCLHIWNLQSRSFGVLCILDVCGCKLFSFWLLANRVAWRPSPWTCSLVIDVLMMRKVDVGHILKLRNICRADLVLYWAVVSRRRQAVGCFQTIIFILQHLLIYNLDLTIKY